MKILILLLSLWVSFPVFAADPVTEVPVKGMTDTTAKDVSDKALINKPAGEPCKADREKFCKDVKPGEGAILRCMKAHKDELSADCKAKGEWMKSQFMEKAKEIHAACSGDVEKFCKDAKGPHEKMHCLNGHSADLSAACKATLPTHMHSDQ